MLLEICVENATALQQAESSGADRIELCSSLKDGGLTPSVGFMQLAMRCKIPVFVMIRPRACDFLYTSDEVELMLADIHAAKKVGAPGVVFGALTENGDIDLHAMKSLMQASKGMEVTFHRAIDQARNVIESIDILASLGVNRILSSGQAPTPLDGIPTLKKMVEYAGDKLKIIAAAVRHNTVREIIEKTGVQEVHTSASIMQKSKMAYINPTAEMGAGEDFVLKVTSPEIVRQLKSEMCSFS